MRTRIVFGHVVHRRLRPVRHAFAYPVFFLRVPLSQLDRLGCRWLSVDRWNLFSLARRDFGPRDGSDLERWARAMLGAHGLGAADGEIVLQAFPRMLGYVFIPITTWHCHDRAGLLRAVICEVSNTFGERHNYVVAHADARPIEAGDWLTAKKALHVSPFCEVVGHYRFRFSGGKEAPVARIDYHDAEVLELDISAEQPVCADDDVHAAVAQELHDFLLFARRAEAGEHFDGDRVAGHAFAERIEMLLC